MVRLGMTKLKIKIFKMIECHRRWFGHAQCRSMSASVKSETIDTVVVKQDRIRPLKT